MAAGKAFRLFTEDAYEELPAAAVPEIKRCRLASLVLQLRVMGISNLFEFEFMDPPPRPLLSQALQELWLLGAIDKTTAVTALGKRMAVLPLEPPFAKLLLEAPRFHCTVEAVTVVAMMAVDSFFFTPPGKKEEAAQARAVFEHADGDHFTYLRVYQGWADAGGAQGKARAWCQQHYVNARNMRKVEEVRQQLVGYLVQGGVGMESCGPEQTLLARCLCTAFYNNVASLTPAANVYKVETSALEVRVHPSSVLFTRRPRTLLFNELVLTTKLYMRHCCLIDAAWLPELVPNLFSTAKA